MNRRIIGLSVVVAICFAAAFAYKFAVPAEEPLEFASVQEARERIEKTGLHCILHHEKTMPSLVVSESKLTDDEAEEFIVLHVTANNAGKVVIFLPNHNYHGELWRHWGQVTATGDKNLLRKIEKLAK